MTEVERRGKCEEEDYRKKKKQKGLREKEKNAKTEKKDKEEICRNRLDLRGRSEVKQ